MEKRFLDTCRVLFAAGDGDNNGFLDREEFVAVLKSRALNLNLTKKEIEHVVNQADRDNNGEITLDEFIPIVRQIFYRKKQKGLGSLTIQRRESGAQRDAQRFGSSGRQQHQQQKTLQDTVGLPFPSSQAKAKGWNLIRQQLPDHVAVSLPRIVKPVQEHLLDFGTIACVAARAAKHVTELDVLRVRRLGLEALKSSHLKNAEEYLSWSVC